MNYIDEIFKRLDIRQIREFLLYGVECLEISRKTYAERIEEAQKAAIEIIQKRFPSMNEYEKITGRIYDYVSVTKDVYMEIGMQCGIVLAMQILSERKRD